jgi:hypothetical protein
VLIGVPDAGRCQASSVYEEWQTLHRL